MANMFNEDGTYNKTEWKAGDKITAAKLNKIELSLEAINNNDIDRHVEADNRLDILEERLADGNEQMDALEDTVRDNKDAADLAIYNVNKKIESLEIVDVSGRLDALESVNADIRLDALESVNADSRLDALEGVNADSRLDALEGVNADSRLDALEGVNADSRLEALEGVNADSRLDALEGVNTDSRLDALEAKYILFDDLATINDLKSKTFNNSIINFENRSLLLVSDLDLVFNNCLVMNLNINIIGYSSLRISGNNYHLENIYINGSDAPKDYYNLNDIDKPLFRALSLSGDNFSLKYSEIKDVISRQALYINNANNFEVCMNVISNCFSYNRINHSDNYGGFDNYGDGIYVVNSRNGIVNRNRVCNSPDNPIGRCGICSEFQTNNIEISFNEVCGYDRGIHIELCDDNIYVGDNNIYACNVCLMCWNPKTCGVVFERNICTNAGLNKDNPSHDSILVYGRYVVAVLGDYHPDQTNGNNVVFKDNEVTAVKNAKHNGILHVENSLPVKFINNKFLRDADDFKPLVRLGSDNNPERIFNAYFVGNVFQTDVSFLYIDNLYVVDNKMLTLQYYDKDLDKTPLENITNRQFIGNTCTGTIPNGGVALFVRRSIIKNNIFMDIKGDYVINRQEGVYRVCEGNTFIKTKEDSMDFNLIKDHARWMYEGTSNYVCGTSPNIFIDETNKLYIRVDPSGKIL